MTDLKGGPGEVQIGGRRVASSAGWAIQREREYIDATAFGDMNKTYLVDPLKAVSGSFHGLYDPEAIFEYGGDDVRISLSAAHRPAWWGRLKHWILRTDWAIWEVASGTAKDMTVVTHDGTISGEFKFNRATLYGEPMSRLEREWDRACQNVRHPIRFLRRHWGYLRRG